MSELATEFLLLDLGFLITDNSSLLDQEVHSSKLNVICKTIFTLYVIMLVITPSTYQ